MFYDSNLATSMGGLIAPNTFYLAQGKWENGVQLILTHWGWDKMADIPQTTFSYAFPSMKMLKNSFTLTEICFWVSNWNNSVLVKIMAWCWLGDKPLSVPISSLTKFTDESIHHSASMSWTCLCMLCQAAKSPEAMLICHQPALKHQLDDNLCDEHAQNIKLCLTITHLYHTRHVSQRSRS